MQVNPAYIQAASRDLQNGICVIDYRGDIEWANRTFTQYFGLKVEGVQYKHLLDLIKISPDSAVEAREVEEDIESGNGCAEKLLFCEHKNGTRVDVFLNVIPIRAPGNEYFPMQYVAYIRQANERGQTSMVTNTCKDLFKSDSAVMHKSSAT